MAANFFPIRSTESVRTCPINAHDFLGRLSESNSRASGKPNLGCLLVIATAITICILSLNISLLRINTERIPDCSCPSVGFKLAHRISPLSIRAIRPTPKTYLSRPLPFRELDSPWRTRAQAGSYPSAPTFRQWPPVSPDSDWGTGDPSRDDPGASTCAHPVRSQPLLSWP